MDELEKRIGEAYNDIFEKAKCKYSELENQLALAKTKEEFLQLAGMYDSLRNYRDSKKLAIKCRNSASDIEERERYLKIDRKYTEYKYRLVMAKTKEDFQKLAEMFDSLGDFRDSRKQVEVCKKSIAEHEERERYEDIYIPLCERQKRADNPWELGQLANEFYRLKEHFDCYERYVQCKEKKEKLENERLMRKRWEIEGRCTNCGGEFIGLFTKKCRKCGKEKSY